MMDMSKLGQHAAATVPTQDEYAASVQELKDRREAAAARKKAAELEKKAAEEAMKAAQEQKEQTQRNARAYEAAVRLFSTSLTQLPMMILSNVMAGRTAFLGLEKKPVTPGGGKAGSPAPGEAGGGAEGAAVAGGPVGIAVGIALTFARVVGDAIKTLMSAPTSGAQVFNKAMGLLTAAVAPVLIPAIFLLSVAAAAASQIIFSELLPVVGELAAILFQAVIPAMVQFAQMLAAAARVGRQAAQFQAKPVDWILNGGKGGSPGAGGGQQGGAMGWLTRNLGPLSGPLGGFVNQGDRAKGQEAVRKAMQETMKEMQLLMMSTPVAAGGSASAYTRAQTAALGQSPFEKNIQDMMGKAIDELVKANNSSDWWGGTSGDTKGQPKGGK